MGQGFTHCKTEPAIQHFFLANPHVYTPYTPYQAEISQGRLELLNNYQQFITKTTTQDVAVASLIDNGQVAMDIMTLMKSQNKKAKYIQKSKRGLLPSLQHQYRRIVPLNHYVKLERYYQVEAVPD